MNNKMAISTYLSTPESKNKLHEPEEQGQIMDTEYFDGCQMGGECEGMGEEVRGLRSTNR